VGRKSGKYALGTVSLGYLSLPVNEIIIKYTHRRIKYFELSNNIRFSSKIGLSVVEP
jgi:hypothetical protein